MFTSNLLLSLLQLSCPIYRTVIKYGLKLNCFISNMYYIFGTNFHRLEIILISFIVIELLLVCFKKGKKSPFNIVLNL